MPEFYNNLIHSFGLVIDGSKSHASIFYWLTAMDYAFIFHLDVLF